MRLVRGPALQRLVCTKDESVSALWLWQLWEATVFLLSVNVAVFSWLSVSPRIQTLVFLMHLVGIWTFPVYIPDFSVSVYW